MDKLRTVSDTKRDFYSHHTRPINSVYRRVVEELLVEMHLLSVNSDFKADAIYYLGVVTSFDRFMQGYQPEKDKESIFTALCQSTGGDPQHYRHQANQLLNLAQDKSTDGLIDWLKSPSSQPETEVGESVAAIAKTDKFKYSRLFASGLYTLLETVDPEGVKDQKQRNQLAERAAEALNLSPARIQKDLDLYHSNIQKMDQLLAVLKDMTQADRKQREKRTLS